MMTMANQKNEVKIDDTAVFDLESFCRRCPIVGRSARWSSCQYLDTSCARFLRRLWMSMATCGKETRQYIFISLALRNLILRAQESSSWMPSSYCTTWSGHAELPWRCWRSRLKIVFFYRYEEISAKDHERQCRADIGSTTFNLTTNSPLPSRKAVVRNKHNKRSLSLLLGTFDLGCEIAYLSKAGITASSVIIKQMSPSAICVAGSQWWLSRRQDHQRRQRHLCATCVLDVALRSAGSCRRATW